uniref:BRCT domain-containing protein n=1 Tax=Strongyloides venezuelensis TaxID=75913 RepID=A0A0K0FEG5_STRVS
MHLNRLRNKLSQDTVKSNSNEISIVSEITDIDLNKSVIASNEEPMEIDISKNNILKNLIRPNVDVNSTFKQEKDIKVKIKKTRNEDIIPNEHYLGHLSTVCDHCQAMFYEKESKYKQCCEFGGVKEYERLFNNFPKFIKNLFIGDDEESIYFKKHCRRINNKFAFASYTGQQRDFKTSGLSTFVLHGEAKRVINTAVPENKDNLSYGQLYFYGPDVAEDIKNKNVYTFNEISVISNLTHIISKINILA